MKILNTQKRLRIMTVRVPEKIQREIEKKGGLKKIISQIPQDKKLKDFALFHQSLSDKNRLKILYFLYYQDACACLLKDVTNLACSKLSYHLKILKEAKLVRCRKFKNYLIYSITKRGKDVIEEGKF